MRKTASGRRNVEDAAPAEWHSQLTSQRLQDIFRYFAASDVSLSRVVASGAIMRASKLVAAAHEQALVSLDLSLPRFEVLGLLSEREDGRMSLRDLRRITLLHPATLTYTTAALADNHLITREPLESDRRVMIAQITDAGRDLVAEAILLLDEIDFGLGDLTDRNAAEVAILLSAMRT